MAIDQEKDVVSSLALCVQASSQDASALRCTSEVIERWGSELRTARKRRVVTCVQCVGLECDTAVRVLRRMRR